MGQLEQRASIEPGWTVVRLEAPHVIGQGALLLHKGDCLASVVHHRFDLAAVTDDRSIRQQPLDVALIETGDPLKAKPRERSTERLALAQDREPGQPGLE